MLQVIEEGRSQCICYLLLKFIPLLKVKSSFKLLWMEYISPCNSRIGHMLETLLLIGLTNISCDKNQF
jgi:hypothetical protein